MILLFRILGRPVTKKNSQRPVMVRGKLRILPSKAHQRWFRPALAQARIQAATVRGHGIKLPLTAPVNVSATFYRKANTGDANNYYAALADLLQAAGIVKDDKLVVSWDGSRLDKDAREPRIDVVIETAKGNGK